MHILRSILFGALVLLFSVTVVAQDHRGERRGFDLEKMTEQLDLTPEQATQLKTIHEEQRAAFAKLAEGLPEGERPDREQMRGLMQQSREKMMTVLNAEQQEKLKTERHKRKGKEGHKRKSKMSDELRSDLRAYRTNTITPKFVEVRAAFDTKLNTTERTQIATLRKAVRSELGEQGLKQLGKRGGNSKGSRHGAERGHKSGEHTSTSTPTEKSKKREEYRTKMRDFMQKHDSDVKAVRDIVRVHQSELTAVRAELDAAKVQWKKDSEAIRAKHMSAEQIAQRKARSAKRTEMHKQSKEGDHKGKRGDRGETFGRSDRGAFMFLLMDPTQMETTGFEELRSEKLSVYPNPATNQTTIKFEVRSSGPVRVELIDASGKVLKTVLEGEREANTYELPVTLPASMGKTGMIRVTDAQGVRTAQVSRG
ncbi:MAG: T9SS type A sorting domain-containing protein [Saprospiraceae bacterium]